MRNHVELPISEPMFSTYGFQILSTAMFEKNPSLKNWAMNSLIFLRCNPDFLTGLSSSPEVFMSRSGYQDCPYLELNEVSLKFLGSKCHNVITSMLDDDCFVYYSNIDNSIIRKKYPHHGKVFAQSGVICGYDKEASTYSILTCDEYWHCQVVKIPQKWIELGRKKTLQSGMFGVLRAVKPKPVSIEVNIKEIHNNLKSYIEYDKKADGPYKTMSKAYGPIVHDYVAMYLNYLHENIISHKNSDPAIFHQIWEHKKCMLERLKIVEDILKLNHNISNKYSSIVSRSESLCEQYKSYCKQKDDSLLLHIRDQIISIGREEELLLNQFVVNMEEVIDL